MKLVDYYTKVLGVLGLHTTEEGFITIDKKGETVWINNGKSLVLPTKDHINTLITEDDDGKPIVSKILFNPLDENVIRGDSISIKKSKEAAEIKLSHAVVTAGTMLLSLATLKKHQSVPMYIQSFLANLKDVVTTANMLAVDDKSIETWNKLYAASHKQNVGIVKIFLKKGGLDSKGVKNNRLATMKFPLYDLICEAVDTKSVLGITLRNKDIKVFKLIHEFLFKEDNLTKMEFGSNDGESPAFISLMSLYVTHSKFPSKVINALKFTDQELFDSAHIDINMTASDMDVGSMFAKELITIPTNVSINKTLNTSKPDTVPVINNPMEAQRDYRTADMTPATYTPNATPVTETQVVEPVDNNASVINSILHGSGGGIATQTMIPTQQHTMVMPQSQMQIPQQSVPMGVDSVPQQVYNPYQQQAYVTPQNIPMGVNTMQQQNYGGIYQPNQAVYNPML